MLFKKKKKAFVNQRMSHISVSYLEARDSFILATDEQEMVSEPSLVQFLLCSFQDHLSAVTHQSCSCVLLSS